ncbi:hypothetical protein BGZ73_002263 [Actinomortierella ambigua]|nr:hypothetical protein BGZ73_002263 [Actinomortierella ambigua]
MNNATTTTTIPPKRKLVVGTVQREGSRGLVNDNELVEALVKAGFRVKWMTFDHGCDIAGTAYLLRDIQVLVSPHGNAIGASLFMPTNDPVPTVVSVDSTRVGRPNYPDDETKARCPPVRDDGIARDYASVGPLVLGLPESMVVSDQAWNAMSPITRDELTKKHRDYVASSPEAQRLAAEELQLLMGAEAPLSIVNKYGSRSWDFMLKYWKAVPRYLDVPRLLQFMERRQQDWERERQQKAEILAAASLAGEEKTLSPYHFYMEYVRKGEVCSANRCEQILTRNVANLSTTAYARHSTDDTERWGQPTKESQSLLSNLMGGVPLQWDFYASLK